MKWLKGSASDSFFSSRTMLKERDESVGNERVAESGNWSELFFQNQQYPSIYIDTYTTECSYVLTGPYLCYPFIENYR
jgi:hypothetical protein